MWNGTFRIQKKQLLWNVQRTENGSSVTWWHFVIKFNWPKICDILWHFDNFVTKCDKGNINRSIKNCLTFCDMLYSSLALIDTRPCILWPCSILLHCIWPTVLYHVSGFLWRKKFGQWTLRGDSLTIGPFTILRLVVNATSLVRLYFRAVL